MPSISASLYDTMILTDIIVKEIILYDAETWRWDVQFKLEKLQRKYIKWALGLDRNTPTYITLEEAKRNKLWIRAIRYRAKK